MYNGSEGITHAATQRPPRYIIHIFTEGGWRNYSGFSAGTQKTRHPRLCGDDEFFGLMDKSGLIIAFPATFLFFLLPLALALAPIGLLRLSPLLRSLFLALRPWCLLLTLTLCTIWLLPLIPECRASLLRSGLVLWLRALASRTALLERR